MTDTPPNNQLIMYRLDELRIQQTEMLDKMDEFLSEFAKHVRDDAIIADRLERAEASAKERPGLWLGVVGTISGIVAIFVTWIKS